MAPTIAAGGAAAGPGRGPKCRGRGGRVLCVGAGLGWAVRAGSACISCMHSERLTRGKWSAGSGGAPINRRHTSRNGVAHWAGSLRTPPPRGPRQSSRAGRRGAGRRSVLDRRQSGPRGARARRPCRAPRRPPRLGRGQAPQLAGAPAAPAGGERQQACTRASARCTVPGVQCMRAPRRRRRRRPAASAQGPTPYEGAAGPGRGQGARPPGRGARRPRLRARAPRVVGGGRQGAHTEVREVRERVRGCIKVDGACRSEAGRGGLGARPGVQACIARWAPSGSWARPVCAGRSGGVQVQVRGPSLLSVSTKQENFVLKRCTGWHVPSARGPWAGRRVPQRFWRLHWRRRACWRAAAWGGEEPGERGSHRGAACRAGTGGGDGGGAALAATPEFEWVQ
jgi:hypothetical protein